MLQAEEFTNDQIINRLRTLVKDLCDKDSPFSKDDAYMRNVAGWLATAATRIEKLKPVPTGQ